MKRWDNQYTMSFETRASKISDFRFVDLFAGIGGFRRGFEAVAGKCVFTCEWNSFARATYLANFPSDADHVFAGDITKVCVEDIPTHDVLLAGFPCQPFSIAGVSKKNSLGREHGFRCETQGTLFFDVARIIDFHRPKVFVLENVKNLIRHDQGATFSTMLRVLEDELGYHVQWRVIDAQGFVPQHRERIFIVGFREPVSFDFHDLKVPPASQGPRLSSILHREDGSEVGDLPYVGQNGKVDERYVLSDKLWEYLQAYAQKHQSQGNGFGFGLVGPNDTSRTLSARYFKDGSEILVRRELGNPRRLTPRECARLMGFDGPSERRFIIPVSDTQAYRQFGNAVVVPVVEFLARALRPYIAKADLDSGLRAEVQSGALVG